MSVFFPYSPSMVLTYYADLFSINLSGLTGYEQLIAVILSNMYFFMYWGFIIYLALKIFNRIWERVF